MNVEELFLRADFSRNPAHREELRRRLFGADGRGLWSGEPDGEELSEDTLEQAAGGTRDVPLDSQGPYHRKH